MSSHVVSGKMKLNTSGEFALSTFMTRESSNLFAVSFCALHREGLLGLFALTEKVLSPKLSLKQPPSWRIIYCFWVSFE